MNLMHIFQGQGSQKKGMGQSFFKKYPEIVTIANNIALFDLTKISENNTLKQLNDTKHTQPILFLVNYLRYLNILEETNSLPQVLAGHSLGEYNALLAASVIDFPSCLKIILKRSQLMSSIKGGGMAAIIGLNYNEVDSILTNNYTLNGIDIANYNSPKQIVISGPLNLISKSQTYFEKANCQAFIPLKVSGPFHSRYMQQIEEEFTQYLNSFNFNRPKIPVISNVTAQYYPNSSTAIKKLLAQQLTSMVKWKETIELVDNMFPNIQIEEIGSGNILTKLISQTRNLQ